MKMISRTPFVHDDVQFEVVVTAYPDHFEVKTLKNGKPANPYRYLVDFMVDFEFSRTHRESAVEHLVQLAQSDVENRVWEKYVEAMKNVKE